jgi:hypothetical protein
VLTSIDFDHDPSIKADEIQDVISKWHLSAKLETDEAAVAQEAPHLRFCVRWVVPHTAGRAADSSTYRMMV